MPILSGSQHALSYARLNKMRLGASRLDFYQPWLKLFINGVDQTNNARVENASIQLTLDGTPSRATFRVANCTPVRGQEIKLYMGDTNVAHLLFAGHILEAATTYEDVPGNVVHDLSCIDYTWRLDCRKVTGKYTNQSATDIVKSLISTYTSGFTTVHVVGGLPTVAEITFTNEDVTNALDRVVQAIGGYWYLDFGKDVHAFLTDSEVTQSVGDTSAGLGIEETLASASDLSQTRTRIWSRGGGSNASSDVAVGQTTLPVEDGVWYSSTGGYVECGPQRITYTGKSTLDGQGAVTSGVEGSAPSPPSIVQSSGGIPSTFVSGNLSVGTFQYKVTCVSGSGEGSASAAAAVSIAAVDPPSTAYGDGTGSTIGTPTTGGSMASGLYAYKVTFLTSAGETTTSEDGYVGTGHGVPVDLTAVPGSNAVVLSRLPISGDGRVTKRRIYRTKVYGGGTSYQEYWLVATINDNSTTTYTDTLADASLGAASPATNTAGNGKVDVSVATGPTGTTSRKIYRTTVGGSTFKLLTTLADNTTTSYLDNVADGSLGATLTSSTVGASPGDTSVLVSDLSKFPSAGWVNVGNQLLRYTGRSASSGQGSLTGIPASGTGAIAAYIPAGSVILVQPHLTGVSGIVYAIKQGDPVNVLTVSNDTAAQSALASAIGSGDGIIEDFITDGRLSIGETQASGDARLALLKDPMTTVTLKTRDQTFRPGRSVSISTTHPAVSGTFKVQRVTISDLAFGGSVTYVFPLRQVEASSRRFSFEGLLRTLRKS